FEINAEVLHTFYGLLDSSVYKGSWQMPSQYKNKKVFTFAKNYYTLGELGKRIESQKRIQRGIPLYTIAKNAFNNFVEDIVIDYEEKQLLENNLDFYYLL
ncbi:MAG TPA: hypothetical protein DG754_09860, partial [Bacteroidales bacterium]|nr:hypothetical protein [Bacteroidales bacterium]